MKIEKENEVAKMLQEAKIFVTIFNELVLNLSQEDINSYRNNLKKMQ